ncbi:MAG TPA: DNA/RNA non-specific endonuclease [Pyrinomonadaceae bacterium]
MRRVHRRAALVCAAALLLLAALLPLAPASRARRQTSAEGFESGTKTSYAAAAVFLSTGWWYMDDALVGNLSTDRKTGAQSARIRNAGAVSTQFDFASAGTVTVQHGVFGTDGASSWELWVSTDGGSTYSKAGSTVNTSSTTLATASFTVNSAVPVRLSIRKTGGGANRVNIDNVTVSAYTAPPPASVHLTMGNPSGAVADVNQPTNYLLDKPQFAVSYHRDKGRPNWVSWHLASNWLGSTPRQDDFRNDATLPAGWYQVQGTDYSGSGFDRGHHCPSADRTLTVADNSSTFLMTNMLPQSPDNNQGPWANMENYLRTLVTSGNELYVVMGGSGSGGTGSNGGTTATIAGGHVAVPSQVWKVVIVLPAGTNDVSRVTTSTRTIAVIMPNTQGIRTADWKTYRVSVDQVETLTGYNFFSNVPATTQNVIESVVDNQ